MMTPGGVSRDGELTFIGTATVLMRYAGLTMLTDPNFLHRGERAYVGMGVSTRRLTEPAMGLLDLPPLDLVVLSHHHGDHFDRRAAAGLRKGLRIISEPHAVQKLRKQGFTSPVPLQTWETWSTTNGTATLSVTAVPAKHAPAPLDRVVPPVMGSVLQFSSSGVRPTDSPAAGRPAPTESGLYLANQYRQWTQTYAIAGGR
jgi:L-ascorbate metabolism protein UlaG (beta-lactamase superfamily)